MDTVSSSKEDEVTKTAALWENIWARERNQRNDARNSVVQSVIGPLLRKARSLFEPDSLSLFLSLIVKREILRERGQLVDVRVLEPGAGGGQSSLLLASETACFTFVDISQSAIGVAQDRFNRYRVGGLFVRASLFDMPFKDETFDVVWNVGVMEHFQRTVQISGLREMHRVCKSGGLIITAVPCVLGKVYLAAKAFAERRGFWEVGYEEPVLTMRDRFSEVEGCQVLREYSVGFLWQFWTCRHFLKVIPHPTLRRFLQLSYFVAFEVLNRILLPLNHLPGSWLVTVCRKKGYAVRP